MPLVPLTLLLIVQAGCEWVEISQQHYKKPLRPAHTHHLLATVGKASETVIPTYLQSVSVETTEQPIRTTNKRPPVRKVNEDDQGNKRNRIYINHTLPDYNWDIPSEQGVPVDPNSVKTKNSISKINAKLDSVVSTNPTVTNEISAQGTKIRSDLVVVRKTKPNKTEIGAKSENPSGHQISVAGSVMKAQADNKVSKYRPKPLNQYKGPIEVMDLSDLEYTTAYDSFNPGLKKGNNDKLKQDDIIAISITNDKRRIHSPKLDIYSDQEISKANRGHSLTNPPAIFKNITNMRRVEILRSTKPTLVDHYDYNTNKLSSSSKPETMIRERNKNTRVGTTPYKFPNIGHVNRVFIENSTRTTRKPKPKNKYTSTESTINGENLPEQIENKIHAIDKPTSTKSTTEKTSLISKPGKLFNNRNQVPSPEDVMLEELITEDDKQFDIKVHKVASIGTVKRVPNPTKSTKLNKNELDESDLTKKSTKPISALESKEDTMTNEDSKQDLHKNYKNKNFETSTEKIPIINSNKIKLNRNTPTGRPEINPQIERYDPNLYKPVKLGEDVPEFVTKDDKFINVAELEIAKKNMYTDGIRITTESNNQENIIKNSAEDTNTAQTESNENMEESTSEEPISNERKSSAMGNLIKFLKTVTNIITRNTRRGVHGKVRYLEDLRDTIMANIEERLEAEFPDDEAGSRRARSAQAQPRGHVEFPSSEGALMTISFLTFAVFLIKLVLQVIQAYKNKTMMVMPTVVAAVGRAYNEHTRTKN